MQRIRYLINISSSNHQQFVSSFFLIIEKLVLRRIHRVHTKNTLSFPLTRRFAKTFFGPQWKLLSEWISINTKYPTRTSAIRNLSAISLVSRPTRDFSSLDMKGCSDLVKILRERRVTADYDHREIYVPRSHSYVFSYKDIWLEYRGKNN